jgi:hypothetical protein
MDSRLLLSYLTTVNRVGSAKRTLVVMIVISKHIPSPDAVLRDSRITLFISYVLTSSFPPLL